MFHGLCHLMDGDEASSKNKICPECDTPFKVLINYYLIIVINILFIRFPSVSNII